MKNPKFLLAMVVALFVFVAGIMLADKYGNAGAAEDNAVSHIQKLYKEAPKSVVCNSVGITSDDNWISCTVITKKDKEVHLLCTGLFDAIVNSCRPAKAIFK